jgi:hypothetical protein
MVMKKLIVLLLAMTVALGASAQGFNPQGQKFSPEKFQADLEQFITKEACLTPQEAARFFPIYKEMQAKQRTVYDRQRQLGFGKPADEKGCEKAIRQRDEYDLELKRIQQTYHNKFLSVISASKLYDVIKAEDRFHRQMLRGWNSRMGMGKMPGMSSMGRHHGSQNKGIR